ncbi:MAG: ATP-binding protein [Beijerinckiaceae bacterium]
MLSRHAETAIRTALGDTRVVAIAGPRQSGKTTLAKAIAGETHTYVTLDDPALLNAARADPSGLIRRLDRAVIDEIQRAPELMLAIKQSVDERPEPGRFLITGSADLLAMPRAAESLAGRIEIVSLLPLSVAEINRLPPPHFLDRLFAGDIMAPTSPSPDLPELLFRGGYPEAVARNDARRRRDWHRAYLKSVLDRDLRDIAAVDKLDRMPELLGLLAARAGQLVNWSSLGNDARLDGKTVERYVRLLENLFILRLLPAWSTNATQRLISTPKVHFLDAGLLASLLNLPTRDLQLDRSPLGPVLESFVLSEILKMPLLKERDIRLSHYRDKDQVEVDIVLEDDRGRIAGIEVKASATASSSDFRGLKRLAERAGERFVCGLLLHDGERTLSFGDQLIAAPINILWQD